MNCVVMIISAKNLKRIQQRCCTKQLIITYIGLCLLSTVFFGYQSLAAYAQKKQIHIDRITMNYPHWACQQKLTLLSNNILQCMQSHQNRQLYLQPVIDYLESQVEINAVNQIYKNAQGILELDLTWQQAAGCIHHIQSKQYYGLNHQGNVITLAKKQPIEGLPLLTSLLTDKPIVLGKKWPQDHIVEAIKFAHSLPSYFSKDTLKQLLHIAIDQKNYHGRSNGYTLAFLLPQSEKTLQIYWGQGPDAVNSLDAPMQQRAKILEQKILFNPQVVDSIKQGFLSQHWEIHTGIEQYYYNKSTLSLK